jgi:hypothetical protein
MMLGSGSWQDCVRRKLVAKTSRLELSSSQKRVIFCFAQKERVDFVQFQE